METELLIQLAQTAPTGFLIVLFFLLWKSGTISFKINGKRNGAVSELRDEVSHMKQNHLHDIARKLDKLNDSVLKGNEETRKVLYIVENLKK